MKYAKYTNNKDLKKFNIKNKAFPQITQIIIKKI